MTAQGGLSVALCTRNGERFVGEQLRTILIQRPPPDEVVVSDDASTDGTLAVVREAFDTHAQPGTRLVVLQNPVPLGVAGNFERAIAACSGDLIALSDQDDRWHDHRLATAMERFAADPDLLLLFSDARLIDESGDPLGDLFASLEVTPWELSTVQAGDALAVLIRRNIVTGATVVLRRRLFDLAVPFPASWVHDEWLALIAAALDGVGVVPRALVDYRQHGANVIGARRLTFHEKLGRLTEPRRERNARLLARAQELVVRVAAMRAAAAPLDPRTEALAAAKLDHERMRSGLPAWRPGRVPRVVSALVSGRYARYGRGLQDALRDMVQPDRVA